jgi:hypothetical protein
LRAVSIYRQVVEQAEDPVENEMLELASVCEEVADNIEDHLTGGKIAATVGVRRGSARVLTS